RSVCVDPRGVCAPSRSAPGGAAVLETIAAVSRREHRLRAAASSGVNGGTSRVLTWPARGAFAITPRAHEPRGGRGDRGVRITPFPFNRAKGFLPRAANPTPSECGLLPRSQYKRLHS